MRIFWRICARFYEKRSRRSLRLADLFKKKAEIYFQRIKGRTGSSAD